MKLLVLSGGRHPFEESTPVLDGFLRAAGHQVTVSEDAGVLGDAGAMGEYDALVFNTLREGETALTEGEQAGMKEFIGGGKGFIWVVLPFVSADQKTDMDWWWGDPDITADYAVAAIDSVCKQWGGDAKEVILTGYSRGAIACNYIGLRNDKIAKLWLGMVPASHYDNRGWKQSKVDQQRRTERLLRLGSTPQYVCSEIHLAKRHTDPKLLAMIREKNIKTIDAAKRELELQSMLDQEGIRQFITQNHPKGKFTFVTFPWVNHDGQWILRDTPSRRHLRSWVKRLVNKGKGNGAPESEGAKAHGDSKP